MITPENLIYLVAGVLAVAVLAKLFAPAPAAAPTPNVVGARYVEPTPIPATEPAQLLAQIEQSIQTQARALAYSRAASAMIEAQARTVPTPWTATAPAAPPATEPPKA